MSLQPSPEIRELLNPGSCYSPAAIRAFLRYSRKRSDDSLPTHLPRTGSCAEHISTVLFPAWLARDTLLDYCDSIAERSSAENHTSLHPSDSASSRPDPRIDAYRARDFDKYSESPEESIHTWVNQELSIESIIRENSCHLLADKCGSFSTKPQSYLNAYKESVYDLSLNRR